eukprot:CAMPEP_0177686124 /NCGR_PEP_ID=MMETSP0447-20121125/33395_1 /TAXON_ID=0 /ORGANISM="Stygamoeba regulata, Strain BSH-02190019" /LENGTH=121 /DNA_ID=CAMNT_0019196213 /DNA_START=143 /DNA_END=505 /DNA_ORIENTATION=+
MASPEHKRQRPNAGEESSQEDESLSVENSAEYWKAIAMQKDEKLKEVTKQKDEELAAADERLKEVTKQKDEIVKHFAALKEQSVMEADRAAYHFQESVSVNSRGAMEQTKHLPPAFFPAVW